MSKIIYDLTAKQIHIGFQEKNPAIIEKETEFVLGKILTIMLKIFSDKVSSIQLDNTGFVYNPDFLLSDKHKKNLLKWLDRLMQVEIPLTDKEFGRFKVDFENWYYQLGGEEISFHYHDDYLLTPKEASERLGVSKVTLNKYVKQGMESLSTNAHRKFPKYVIELWKDPVYSIRMQMIAQEKKLRNQTPLERLEEINTELTMLEAKYKASSFEEAFGHLHGDNVDDPTDYYLWRDLEEEKKEILKLMREE